MGKGNHASGQSWSRTNGYRFSDLKDSQNSPKPVIPSLFLPPWGYLAMSRDIFGCYTWVEGATGI